MGEAALSDAGYYNGKSPGYNQEWRGEFSGKDNVKNKEDFLKNAQAQENAIRDYMKKQWQILQSNGSTKYIGSKINGIDITPSGLLAMGHLKGGGYVSKYLGTNGTKLEKDGFGTNPEEYLKKFGGYDVSEITDPNYYAPTFGGTQSSMADKMLNQGRNVISGVASKVMPPSSSVDKAINNVPIQPPLTDEEWYKRLKRQRMGL
ncbi:MAG: hypothetical protein NC408_07925 [Candidatus Gastranaerophilales bacterium]|nr:hypothetical protein [Candidatus Gastranaerophilales bacterium]MCM1072577.1 hypothetical protein [Bacteroides sp.]